MRVFVTGGSGFIGSAVIQELLQAGHRVLALARSDQAAQALVAAGAEAHRGELSDLASLRSGAEACEGVAHLAFLHDFSNMAASGVLDLKAVETLGASLAGTGKPLVVTSAIGVLTPGRVGRESDAPDAASGGKHRLPSELAALATAQQGVRASVIRLPPSVHGAGDRGFVPAMIRVAREKGVSAHVAEGTNRWPAVHRLDAARLFRLALERGAAGSVFHGVADEGVPTRQIAECIARTLKLPVVSKSRDEALTHFGWLGRFLMLDVPASSEHTQKTLGWKPEHPGLLADLATNYGLTA